MFNFLLHNRGFFLPILLLKLLDLNIFYTQQTFVADYLKKYIYTNNKKNHKKNCTHNLIL